MLTINLNLPTLPTSDQKDAMDGANAPDSTNVFATANDLTPQVNSDWNAVSGVEEILNKPTISGTNTGDQDLSALAPKASPTFTGTVVLPTTTSIGNVSSTEIGYVDGVTSAIQTQIDLKSPLSSPTFTGTVTSPAIILSSETVSTIASFDASKNIKSLPLATYPSLTELSYVKGVTSAIQTQINSKSALGFTIQTVLSAQNFNPADSTTYYIGTYFSNAAVTIVNSRKTFIPKNCTLKNVYISSYFTNGTNQLSTLYFRLNNTTDTIISSNIDLSSAPFSDANTSLNIPLIVGDYFELKWTTPVWVTNPTNLTFSAILYFE